MKRQDILIDEEYNFQSFEGDLDYGDSVQQDARNIIYNSQGDWRATPLLGAGLRAMLNAPITTNIQRIIRLQLDADGIGVARISGDLENLTVILNNEKF